MNVEATLEINAAPSVAHAAFTDMGGWAAWNTLVTRVTVDRDGPTDYPAWHVDLGARIGLFRLTRHLRMVLVEAVPEESARFERFELDDDDHSDAVIEALLVGDRQWLLRLDYSGFLPIPGVVPFVRNEIAKSLRQLNARLAG